MRPAARAALLAGLAVAATYSGFQLANDLRSEHMFDLICVVICLAGSNLRIRDEIQFPQAMISHSTTGQGSPFRGQAKRFIAARFHQFICFGLP